MPAAYDRRHARDDGRMPLIQEVHVSVLDSPIDPLLVELRQVNRHILERGAPVLPSRVEMGVRNHDRAEPA